MGDDQKKLLPINYTNRDYQSIRKDLLEIAERFYPDTFQDFSDASFGSLMIDTVAYVGDQLSFYLDYNINEAFLDTAYQYNNVLRHGRIMGYKYTGRPSTYGQAALFILIPASSTGIGPDTSYIPVLKRGSRFTSQNGLNFVLTENIDFSKPEHKVVVARVDETTGAPTYFAIKAYGNVVSGYFGSEQVIVGSYKRFKKIKLTTRNISEIISITDSDGNEYFEVDYLSQDIIYKEITNDNYKNDNVPSILKPVLVSRKFVVEKDRVNTFLQFGSGNSAASNIAADPQTVALDIFGKTYVTSTTFDPSQLTRNENFGIVPSSTTLTIVYRVTNPTNSNVAVGGLNAVGTVNFDFKGRKGLSGAAVSAVINSLEVNNETPIVGNVTNPTTNEIKRRIFDTFATQNRAVTQADYENVAYRMGAKYGSIKRCSVQRDPSSAKRNLNMYIISEDSQGKLTKTNATIKNNLKTWLNHFRMMGDTIDLLDPYIINLGIEFEIKASVGADKFTTLKRSIDALAAKYQTPYYIGEAFYISEIYETLKNVKGVMDVTKVKIITKSGANYSSTQIDINSNLSPDGSYLIVPKNAIVEIKFPQTDITGKVR